MKRISWAFVLTVGGIFLIMASSAWPSPITLKFGTFVPPQGWDTVQIFKPWAEMVEKDAGGTLKIEIYAGGTLGRNPAQYVSLVKEGVMDIGFMINTYQPGRFLDDEITNLPFVAKESVEATVAYNRLLAKGMIRGYEDVIPIGAIAVGQWLIHTTFPVKRPEDIRGKKMHASGKLTQACAKSFGVAPLGITVAELAETINNGVIQGVFLEWNSLKMWRVLDLLPYHCVIPFGTGTISIIMNKGSFDKLPPQAKAAITKHSGESYSRDWSKRYSNVPTQVLEEIKANPKHHVYIPTPAELEQWKAIVWPVVEKWKSDHPKGNVLYDAYVNEIEKYRKE